MTCIVPASAAARGASASADAGTRANRRRDDRHARHRHPPAANGPLAHLGPPDLVRQHPPARRRRAADARGVRRAGRRRANAARRPLRRCRAASIVPDARAAAHRDPCSLEDTLLRRAVRGRGARAGTAHTRRPARAAADPEAAPPRPPGRLRRRRVAPAPLHPHDRDDRPSDDDLALPFGDRALAGDGCAQRTAPRRDRPRRLHADQHQLARDGGCAAERRGLRPRRRALLGSRPRASGGEPRQPVRHRLGRAHAPRHVSELSRRARARRPPARSRPRLLQAAADP